MNFNALLVSLIPQDDDLFHTEHKDKNISHFEKALDYSKERNDDYSIKIYLYDQDLGLMAGVISKKSKVELHRRDFSQHEEDDFPPVIWFWDRVEQVILVEKKTKVFSTENVIAKAFEIIANNEYLVKTGLRAHIEPKLDDSAFWESYDEFKLINQVQFKLTAPNLFGDTKKEVGEFLHKVVDETNANEFSPTFKNDDFKLSLKPSKWLNALIDWTKEGAGSWTIRGKKSYEDPPTVIHSSKRAKIVHVRGKDITELDLEGYSINDLKQILEVLRKNYTFRR